MQHDESHWIWKKAAKRLYPQKKAGYRLPLLLCAKLAKGQVILLFCYDSCRQRRAKYESMIIDSSV